MTAPFGAGAPLAAGVKAPLERSFGADLSGVRVHTEISASTAADAVGAKAFAYGSDIVLSSRSSAHDLGLMAHETAHVLQQNGGPARVQNFGGQGSFEREADRASAAVLRGEPYQIALATAGPRPQFGFWSTLASTVTEGIDGLVDKAVAYIRERARSIPGYDLLAVAIGKDPLNQAPVDRSATNIIKGLLSLIPGGAAIFENLQQSGVIQRAADWITAEVTRLNLTWARVSGTISSFIGSLGASDLLNLGGVFVRAAQMFGSLVRDIVSFAAGAAEKLFEFIFEGALALAGSGGQMVLGVLRKAGAVIKRIIADPIGFLKNLLAAVFGGFKQFGANILAHLKNAIFDWLFGAMAGAGIQLPKKFDLQGILSLVLQVLGLTWQNLRLKLVRALGEPVVAGIEKTFDFLVLLATQGIGAAWKKVLEFASGIADTVIEGIKSWVKTTIVGQAVIKLVSMANPVGAIIQSIIAIYNTVMFVVERAKQIMAFVTAVTDSIANIAAGRIGAAIAYVEQTLARILPLVISFLARFIGLGGISNKIKQIITKIRAPIDKAMDKIVAWLAKQARNLRQTIMPGGRRETPNSPEGRKQAALAEVRTAMARGIRRSSLIALTGELRKRYQLKKCELRGAASVFVENSEPELIEGSLSFSPDEIREPTMEKFGQPGGPGGGDLHLGEYQATVRRGVQTIRGVMREHMNGGVWPDPHGAMPDQASRPEKISAKLVGRLNVRMTRIPRDSEMTRMVGHLGDFERSFRRGIWSAGQFYQGGHLIGHQFGGEETFENLVAMVQHLNVGLYANVETFINEALPRVAVGTPTDSMPTVLELEIRVNYGGDPVQTISRLVNIIGTKFGADNAARDRFASAVKPAAFRQRVTLPARVPTGFLMSATLLTGGPAASNPVPAAATGTTGTMGVTRSDPVITRRAPDPNAPPTRKPAAVSTGPRRWHAQWNFTQSNQ